MGNYFLKIKRIMTDTAAEAKPILNLIQAACDIVDPAGASGIGGRITMYSYTGKKTVYYQGTVTGLTPGKHGFHTHTTGVLTKY